MILMEEDIDETLNFAPALPLEIFDMIFTHIEEHGDTHDWYRFSLVNHNWYSAATPRLYHTFRNNGDLSGRERLWQFMRTVVEMPDLAQHVKVVDLQHCLKYTGPRSEPLAKRLCDEYLPILDQGMYESGIDYYEPEETLEALRADNRQPIVAMILACVPNLESLSMHVTYDDRYLRAVAENAPIPTKSRYFCNDGRKRFAFKRLKQLSLTTDDQPYWNLPLQVDRCQPFIFFPQLRELTLLRTYLDPALFSWRLSDEGWGGEWDGMSPHLTKVNIDLHRETLLEDFLKFLDRVPLLTSLSVDFSSTPQSEWTLHGPAALWNRLIQFKTTLETLDLYGVNIERSRPDAMPFCPPLEDFKKLKSLGIGPAVLLGNCKGHNVPFQLAGHVPQGLDFLSLYADPSSHRGNWAVRDLETQLEVLAMDCQPKVVRVEGIGKRRIALLPVRKLEIACDQKQIKYSTARRDDESQASKFAQSSYRHERPNNPRMQQTLLEILDRTSQE